VIMIAGAVVIIPENQRGAAVRLGRYLFLRDPSALSRRGSNRPETLFRFAERITAG